MNMPSTCYLTAVGACFVVAAMAPSQALSEQRFVVRGDVLAFDMSIPYDAESSDRFLVVRDVEEVSAYLFEFPEISTILIEGPGGDGPAGRDIASIIMHLGLDTRVEADCMSACARMFLAGANRTLVSDARLGFHRPYVVGEDERRYYEAMRDMEGWDNPFDYVEWIYDVGLTDMLNTVAFMTSRGVSVDFIIEAFSHDSYDMWFPDRETLMKHGVVTELEDVAQ